MWMYHIRTSRQTVLLMSSVWRYRIWQQCAVSQATLSRRPLHRTIAQNQHCTKTSRTKACLAHDMCTAMPEAQRMQLTSVLPVCFCKIAATIYVRAAVTAKLEAAGHSHTHALSIRDNAINLHPGNRRPMCVCIWDLILHQTLSVAVQIHKWHAQSC